MPEEALEVLGAPDRLLVVRGPDEALDDVVFFYEPGFHLFWYEDRVWQVRLDARHQGRVEGIELGWTPDQVRAVLGAPDFVLHDSIIYELPDRGYPVRMRLFFDEGRLFDLYVYRGDF